VKGVEEAVAKVNLVVFERRVNISFYKDLSISNLL
jgi:hypothetical protein